MKHRVTFLHMESIGDAERKGAKMILTPAPISTRAFRYHAGDNTFTAELSDLGPNFRMGRVYDDACDEGITLVSHKTGRQVVFAVSELNRDREGDLTDIVLTPADRKMWGAGRVVLFND